MRKLRVYTAGYMHGEGCDRFPWRDQLDNLRMLIDLLHPGVPPGDIPGSPDGTHGWYAPRDVTSIRACDLLFAYLDLQTNRCLGVSWEMGYASAMGKPVVLVEPNDFTRECASLDLARALATSRWPSLEDGIEHLKFLADGFLGIR